MKSFIDFFNCGYTYKNREAFVYRVEKSSDVQNKVIPFFKKYPIPFGPKPAGQGQGVKYLNYLVFCKAAEYIKNKEHLTKQGLDKIKEIKTGMNKGRIWE